MLPALILEEAGGRLATLCMTTIGVDPNDAGWDAGHRRAIRRYLKSGSAAREAPLARIQHDARLAFWPRAAPMLVFQICLAPAQ
jgi:hypothetical protein